MASSRAGRRGPPAARRPPARLASASRSRPWNQARRDSQRSAVALPAPVPRARQHAERLLAGRGRVVELVGQVALVRMALQQVGQLRRGQSRRRSAAPARTGRPPRGGRRARPPAGRRPARGSSTAAASPAALGVVGEPGRVLGRARPGQQRGQGAAVQVRRGDPAAAPARRPGGRARGGRRRRRPAPGASRRPRTRRGASGRGGGHLGQQPGLDRRGHHRGGVEDLPGRRRQPGGPGQHGVRTVAGIAASPAASTSVTKNGFPPVVCVERVRVDAVAGRPATATASRDRGASGSRRTGPRWPGRRARSRIGCSRADLVVPVGDDQQRWLRDRAGGPGTGAGRGWPRRPSGRPR